MTTKRTCAGRQTKDSSYGYGLALSGTDLAREEYRGYEALISTSAVEYHLNSLVALTHAVSQSSSEPALS